MRMNFAAVALALAALALLASCGKREEAKVEQTVDKAAVELKANVEAEAKKAEAAAKDAPRRRKPSRWPPKPMSMAIRW